MDCQVCGCRVRKNKCERHVKTEKHRKAVEGGGGDGKVGGDMVGAKGWAELYFWQRHPLLIYIYTVIIYIYIHPTYLYIHGLWLPRSICWPDLSVLDARGADGNLVILLVVLCLSGATAFSGHLERCLRQLLLRHKGCNEKNEIPRIKSLICSFCVLVWSFFKHHELTCPILNNHDSMDYVPCRDKQLLFQDPNHSTPMHPSARS